MSVLHLHVHCMCEPSSPIKNVVTKTPNNTALTIGHEPTSQAGRSGQRGHQDNHSE